MMAKDGGDLGMPT